METAATALPEGSRPLQVQEQEQQQEALQGLDQLDSDTKIHALDDTEDYGPLKKKHKYRDERDKERASGSQTAVGVTTDEGIGNAEQDTTLTLDSSTEMENSMLTSPAVVANASAGTAAAVPAGQDQDHVDAPGSTSEAVALTTAAAGTRQQNTETSTSTKTSTGSPASATEKTRKHNFYVPSRELAALFDNASSTPSSCSANSILPGSNTTATSGTVTNGSNSNELSSNISEAQLQANTLLSIGTGITGRQAAKIAAMEAKEKLRLAKEAEIEEAKNKRRMELERKKIENAKKKADKEATTSTTMNLNNTHQQKRKDSMNSQSSNPTVSGSTTKTATAKGKRSSTTTSRRSNTKAAKHESPEISISNNVNVSLPNTSSLASPDIKVHPPSTTATIPILPPSNSNIPINAGPSHVAAPPSTATTARGNGGITLPPMPAPATEGMMGFIPYASEGARAAALAKAAKQKLNAAAQSNNNNNGSPSNLPVGLPSSSSSSKNGKSSSSSGTGRKGSTSGNSAQQTAGGIPYSTQFGTAQQQQGGGGGSKRSKGNNNNNNTGNNNNSAKTKALQNITTQHNNSFSSSGRASPSNALEHAAAAIDAVLDAGALARAQAQAAEEEEVDDRLYCICQQLYDPERLMIACDRCDNWYHVDCVNIDEASISLIDLFICPICEKDSNLRTVSKARCAREECNEPALKLSKYCSDLCGLKVATSKLETSSINNNQNKSNSEELKLLWDAVFEVKKLETVVRSVDIATEEGEDGKAKEAGKSNNRVDIQEQNLIQTSDNSNKIEDYTSSNVIPKDFSLESRIAEEEYRLEQLQTNLSDYVSKRENLEVSLSLINARLSYLNLAVRRWELACQAHAAHAKPTTSNKKSSKSKSGGSSINADAPCGFDVRLVWDDKDWQEWLDSEEGRHMMTVADEGDNTTTLPLLNLQDGEEGNEDENEEEGLVCRLSRRKCDRHSAWQKLRDADFQVEKAAIEKQLEQLTEGERKIRRRVEDIQDFLRRGNERLESEKAKETEEGHAGKDEDDEDMARPPNAEEGNEIEEVEMSDSMPPTPAVVLTEA